MAEVQRRLDEAIGSMGNLTRLVGLEWRPGDLKAFDRSAPQTETLVYLSPTERACALSHLSCWKGVVRSLQLLNTLKHSKASPWDTGVHSEILLRQFKISGFAQGPALFPENQNMSPSPVCVVLEDDAILIDRFAERLQALLIELPRDFHFCSIGFSRPKTAPIVPFSSVLGIPTMIWYLTGYILSEHGARYLLDSAPIVGPVDSWVGLKMANLNWDNTFGVSIGLGTHSRSCTGISRKDLRRIMKFRAFCSRQPLCWQRVGNGTNEGFGDTIGRNWRLRDTDIEFSGDKLHIPKS